MYAHLDIILADKFHWERKLDELLKDDLNVNGKYSSPSDYKRIFERAIAQIDGKPISTGTLRLSIDRTKDNSRYKLVVKKEPAKTLTPLLNATETSLVMQILEVTGDPHSKRFYEKMVREYPESLIYRVLSETRDADHRGAIKVSRGKFFTSCLKRLAVESCGEKV